MLSFYQNLTLQRFAYKAARLGKLIPPNILVINPREISY
jgi:hypothetical protein